MLNKSFSGMELIQNEKAVQEARTGDGKWDAWGWEREDSTQNAALDGCWENQVFSVGT